MTPKREAYLAKCGELEKKYREWIAKTKEIIKDAKANLNDTGVDVEWEKNILRSHKLYLGWYRHELNRLKGMDRVARIDWTNTNYYGDLCGRCKCGNLVTEFNKYCDECGRRLLCKKVK